MTRTPYMQSLMQSTYSLVAIEAIMGGFEGAWQRVIANKIHQDYLSDHPEACEIVNSVKAPGQVARETYLLAAYLVTSSVIAEEDSNDLKEVRFGQ